jgi:hypothetical protein
MHCQCLLPNDLIQYGYGNASGRCLSNRFLGHIRQTRFAGHVRRARDDSQPLPLVVLKQQGCLRGVRAWKCIKSVIFLPSRRN